MAVHDAGFISCRARILIGFGFVCLGCSRPIIGNGFDYVFGFSMLSVGVGFGCVDFRFFAGQAFEMIRLSPSADFSRPSICNDLRVTCFRLFPGRAFEMIFVSLVFESFEALLLK